jgi:hypothetical protein
MGVDCCGWAVCEERGVKESIGEMVIIVERVWEEEEEVEGVDVDEEVEDEEVEEEEDEEDEEVEEELDDDMVENSLSRCYCVFTRRWNDEQTDVWNERIQ